MLKRVTRAFWYSGAALLILLALLLSTARLVLPLLDDYHDELQQWLSQQVNLPVRIERLDLGWHGLGPDLRLLNTRLYDSSGEEVLLRLDELRLGIDLWRSWREQRLVSNRIALYGTELNLIRRKDGRVVLRGREHATPIINPLELASEQPRIELRDVTLGWEDRYLGHSRVELHDIALNLRNRGDRHQFHLTVRPAAAVGQALELQADLVLPDKRDQWQGRLYLDARGFMLREWLGWYLSERWFVGGMLDTRLWATLRAGRLADAEGEVTVHLPVFSSRDRAAPLFAGNRLATRVHWNRAEAAWRLNLDQLELVQADRTWPESGLSLVMAPLQDGGQQLQLAVDALPLELLQSALPLLEQRLALPVDVAALQPRGWVRGLQIGAERRGSGWRDLRFKARLDDLAWQPHARLPGLDGLNADLIGTPQWGRIELALDDGHFHAPALFRASLPIEHLAATVHWQRNDQALQLHSPAFELATPDLAGRGRLDLTLPRADGSPRLDLHADIERGSAAMTSRYLPAGIMRDKALAWLDRAIVSGDIRSGSVDFNGRLADFPFEQGEGRMEIRARVDNAILDYHPDWHRIEELDAELVFINRSMHIEAVEAAILGTRLWEVTADIPDLRRSRLALHGRVRGPLDDMLRFVEDSPLSRRGYALGQLQGGGEAGLELDLDLPLRRTHERVFRVAGRLRLQDNRLRLPQRDLALEALTGEVGFSESEVRASEVQARLWDTPVSLDLAPHPHTDGMTRLQLDGRLPLLERLGRQYPPLARHVSGRTDWRIRLDVGPQAEGYPLQVDSDLRGVAIDLPPPLAKAREAARPLRLQTRIQGQGSAPLYLGLGPLHAALELERTAADGPLALTRAMLRFNAGPAQLPEGPGLELDGRLEQLPLAAWQQLLDRAGEDAALPALDLRRATLQIQKLELFNQQFSDVNARVQPVLGAWEVALEGPDIAGRIALPRGDSSLPVDLDLEHLSLVRGGINGEAADIDPARLPPLDADIEAFTYGDLELGRVRLRSEPLAHGLEVDTLIEGDWLKLSARGNWTRRDGREASRFDIEVNGSDLGQVLTAFGYSGNVEDGPTHGEINANWPGAPTDFALARVEGTLDLRIGAGQLVKLEPGAGRVFGLLNLHALPRRLTLDFSDLFKRGFAFDRIEGSFTLLDANAYTQDLVIQGPSARIDISGRIGLAERDYDQLVTVSPEVTGGLPIAGAIAGGPAVGAALFLADRLLGRQFGEMASYQYAVTGGWEDPVFRRLDADAPATDAADEAP